MTTIFYNYLLGTEKLATTITDKSPEELILEGVIPKDASYLVQPDCNDTMTEEEQLKYKEIQYAYFDNYDNPTEVKLDYNAIMFSLVEEMRPTRNKQLRSLDILQQRAITLKKDDVISEIEEDKQQLRDCLNNIDVFKYNTLEDFTEFVDLLFNEIINDMDEVSESVTYQSPEDYKEKTVKRFRMTKDQKERGLSREDAFLEFLESSN